MKRTIIFFGVLYVLVVVLHFAGALNWLDYGLTSIMNPSLALLNRTRVRAGSVRAMVTQKTALAARIRALEAEKVALDELRAANLVLEEENKALKEQLNFFETNSAFQQTACPVIGKIPDAARNALLIGCGKRAGVAKGQAVIAGSGVLVGKIDEAKEHVAVVALLNDAKSKVGGGVLNADKSIGVVQGGFGISIALTLVPEQEALAVGDLVVTSGLDEGVPRGLLIGTIESKNREMHAPFQRATIRPPLPYQKLFMVGVLRYDAAF